MKSNQEQKEVCAHCGLVVVNANKASITSWIFEDNSCKCLSSAQRERRPPRRVITVAGLSNCSQCGMLKRPMRLGSLTGWMFSPLSCECPDEPVAGLVELGDVDGVKSVGVRKAGSSGANRASNASVHGESNATGDSSSHMANIVIEERYKVLGLIGSGGMSAVYRAFDLKLERQVALKFLLGHQISHAQVARFQQEASVMAKVSHPNIVPVLDFGLFRMQPYMVLELFEAPSILEILQDAGPFTIATALSIFEQLCEGLGHAHRLGVTHRDLKPSNVLLSGKLVDPKALILDFGICKWEQAELTQQGEQLGSPIYMSPEQRRGQKVDHRSDIYSMGCLMFEVLCGEPAFSIEDVLSNSALRPPRLTIENLSRAESDAFIAMRTIIERCLEEDPSARFQSMNELRTELSKSTDSAEQSRPQALVPGRRLSRAAIVVLLVVIVGIGSVMAYVGMNIASRASAKKVDLPENSASTAVSEQQNLATLVVDSGTALKVEPPAPVGKLPVNPGSHVPVDPLLSRPSPSISRTDKGMTILKYPTPEYARTKLAMEPRQQYLMIEEGQSGVIQALPQLPLRWLVLCQSELSDADWKRVTEFSNLQYFDLTTRNKIGARELKTILKLKELRTLGVCGTPVPDEFLHSLGHLKLTVLIFEFNHNVDDRTISKITHLSGLEQLWLAKTNITAGALSSIAKLPALRFLDLSENDSLSDAALETIGKMKGLEELRIIKCPKLSVRAINRLIAKRPNLRIVRQNNGFAQVIEVAKRSFCFGGRPGIPRTGKFEQVASDFWQSRNPTIEDLRALRAKEVSSLLIYSPAREILSELVTLPIKRLSLAYDSDKLGSDDLKKLAACDSLESLSLYARDDLTDEELQALATIRQLKELAITSQRAISPGGLANLKALPRLERLDMSYNSSVDDTCLEGVSVLGRLKQLSVVHTDISSDGLLALARMSSLTTLDISGNERVTDNGLRYLARCRSLKQLRVESCRQITTEGLRLLRLKLPSLVTSNSSTNKVDDLYALKESGRLFNEARQASELLVPGLGSQE